MRQFLRGIWRTLREVEWISSLAGMVGAKTVVAAILVQGYGMAMGLFNGWPLSVTVPLAMPFAAIVLGLTVGFVRSRRDPNAIPPEAFGRTETPFVIDRAPHDAEVPRPQDDESALRDHAYRTMEDDRIHVADRVTRSRWSLDLQKVLSLEDDWVFFELYYTNQTMFWVEIAMEGAGNLTIWNPSPSPGESGHLLTLRNHPTMTKIRLQRDMTGPGHLRILLDPDEVQFLIRMGKRNIAWDFSEIRAVVRVIEPSLASPIEGRLPIAPIVACAYRWLKRPTTCTPDMSCLCGSAG